jgi:hypothetical protein
MIGAMTDQATPITLTPHPEGSDLTPPLYRLASEPERQASALVEAFGRLASIAGVRSLPTHPPTGQAVNDAAPANRFKVRRVRTCNQTCRDWYETEIPDRWEVITRTGELLTTADTEEAAERVAAAMNRGRR